MPQAVGIIRLRGDQKALPNELAGPLMAGANSARDELMAATNSWCDLQPAFDDDSAAATFDARGEALALRLATAETFLWGRGTEIISDCIQLCGRIGFTWEWGHHLYLRRTVPNCTLGMGYGRPRRRLAEEAGW